MRKTLELCKVRQGETFTLGGMDFVKLDDCNGAVFALTADIALEKHLAICNALVGRQIDLTTMDGMTDYGCPLVTVWALTIDEYRKYRMMHRAWCNSGLKTPPLKKLERDATMYLGIAADEPNRFHNLTERKRSPLAEHDITEAQARSICEELGLLSPIYTQSTRGGCWFCHNQPIGQLRLLRRQYPDYWALMMKWDSDSPSKFKPDGTTVHDFDQRFANEDAQTRLF